MKKFKKLSIRPIAITSFLLILQLFLLLLFYTYLKEYQSIFNLSWGMISLLLVLFIMNREDNSAYKISWIIPMCIAPLFGLVLYLIIKVFPGTKRLSKKLSLKIEQSKSYLEQDSSIAEAFEKISPYYYNMSRFLCEHESFPIYANNELQYFPLGELAFESIKEEIGKAKKYIFLEFFILSKGDMVDELLYLLEEKANSGVLVRLMYDGSNMFSLPGYYPEFIKSKGIECKIFSPVTPILSSYQNNRDHRKIIVIDGKVGFTGGMNIADEYINKKERFGHWKDAFIKIEGSSIKTLTTLFLQMWNIDLPDIRSEYDTFLDVEPRPSQNSLPCYENFVIPYADYPENENKPAKSIYTYILFYAKRYVDIMSPYLLMDEELITAMKFASKRGVKIRLLLPQIPDKKIPYMIAQSYFPELLYSGIEIFLYAPGFVHSKIFVSDDIVSTVGTVNLDYRSFYLHFENGVFCYDTQLASSIQGDFEETLLLCNQMSPHKYYQLPLFHRLLGKFFRLFAPLM